MSDPDDDFLDGMCDLDFEVEHPVPDEWTPWVVLFCDLLDYDLSPRSLRDVEARAAEWRELFDAA